MSKGAVISTSDEPVADVSRVQQNPNLPLPFPFNQTSCRHALIIVPIEVRTLK